MGKVIAFVHHIRWTETELEILRLHYATATYSEMEQALPGRKRRQIQCSANRLGLSRIRPPTMTDAERARKKREGMARLRISDIEKARRKAKEWRRSNLDREQKKAREYHGRRFFWGRANKLRGAEKATAVELARLWKRQRGRCALTGRKLDRTAQLDHVIARARGGNDNRENLRWLCREANLARRELSDAEFLALCSDVLAWIGRRIRAVEASVGARELEAV